MNYNGKKFKRRNKSKIPIMLIISMVLIVGILNTKYKFNLDHTRNLFYVKVLNYAMPMVKTTSFDEEDIAENKFTLKNLASQVMSINLNNPETLINKELPVIAYNKNNEELRDGKLDSFNLDEKEICKYNSEELNKKSKASGDLNLQNKVVTVVNPKLKRKFNPKKPQVFIYHTHTCESYTPGDASSMDMSKNICSVGDELSKDLKDNYGINTVHDKTVHDAQAYTKSYSRSSITVDKYLKAYGDFDLIIDMHRDSVGNHKKLVTTQFNGENVAKISLIMTKKNPHASKNLALAKKIANTSDRLFPGFCRGVDTSYNYGTRFFNQDKSNNAVLIEVGADCNSTLEAKASAKYIARIIAECLNK